MDADTETVATFTGTLLRREHGAGQKFVQLVFREGGQNWLCVSSKLSHVKLTIGQSYHVEGIFKQFGERTYIHEPKIVLSKRQLPFKRVGIIAGVVLGIGAIGITAFAAAHSDNSGAQDVAATPAAAHVASQPVQATASTDASQPVQTSPIPPTTNTSSAATTPKPTDKTIAKASTAGSTGTSQKTAPAVATPYCDAATVLAFQVVHVDDPSLPVGTSQTVQAGANGSSQVCYSDGTAASAQTKTVEPTDEIIHDGTATDA
jgi:hypothetical protein